jgi:hypothetical protein
MVWSRKKCFFNKLSSLRGPWHALVYTNLCPAPFPRTSLFGSEVHLPLQGSTSHCWHCVFFDEISLGQLLVVPQSCRTMWRIFSWLVDGDQELTMWRHSPAAIASRLTPRDQRKEENISADHPDRQPRIALDPINPKIEEHMNSDAHQYSRRPCIHLSCHVTL